MIFLDELKPLTLYKKPFHLPIDEKDKKKGAVSFLLTPSYDSSIQLMNNPLMVNNRYYESYYIEKDITYFINQEGYLEDISDKSYRNVINESNRAFISNKIDNVVLEENVTADDDYEQILEAVKSNLYFLSQDNMDNKILTPRVPSNFLTKNGYEENKTPRVCFSTSVSKCLTALSMNCKDKEFYVHIPVGEYKTHTPTIKEVPDRNITGEVWIKNNITIKCIGKILVTNDDGKEGKKYKYGDNREAELYGWEYKWIERYPINESSNEILNDPKRHIRSLKMKMNKAKYELNRQADKDRNNVGIEKDSKVIDDTLPNTTGDNNMSDINKANKEKVNESYTMSDSSYYGKRYKSAVVDRDYTKGEVIDILDSELGRSFIGPCRDGYNVIIQDGKCIACENIRKGSNLFANTSTIDESTITEITLFYKDKDSSGNINIYANKNFKTDMYIGNDKSLIPHYIKSKKDGNVRLLDTEYISTRPISKGEELILVKDTSINENYIGPTTEQYTIDDSHIRCRVGNDSIILAFNEMLDETILQESSVHNTVLHKLLYKERFKNNKEVFEIHDKVKQDIPWIKRTFIDYERYKNFNLFVDLSFYNQTFFKNNIYKLDKAVDLYFEFINRFINDRRLDINNYTKKTVFVPVSHWSKEDVSIYKFSEDINPISMITRLIRTNITKLIEWKGIDFIFITDNGYFKIDLSDLETSDLTKFINLIKRLRKNEPIEDVDNNIESKKAIVANIVDKIETSQKIKINNLTGDSKEVSKDELVQKIEKAASISANTDDAIENLEKDDYIKNIIATLSAEEDDNVKINGARVARMNKLNDEFLNKKLNGKTVRSMINNIEGDKELPVRELAIDTVNDEWKNLQYINFEESYNLEEDIVAALYSLSNKTVPVMVRDIRVEDNSTSEDMIYTYIVEMEDVYGSRFTIKFDIPKLKDHKFMRLRGNDKTINGQLTQIPIGKTDEDIVQIVSNYKKIFISRYGTSSGKSYVMADRIIKAIKKMESKQIKVVYGDNSRICSKYELPIDFIDLATVYSTLETKEYLFIFNQDNIRKDYKIDESKGIPVGINLKDKSVIYYDNNENSTFSDYLYAMLSTTSSEFNEILEKTSISTRYTYSKASILNNHVPIVVIMGYNEGLIKTLEKANVKYELVEKRPSINKNIKDIIKFKDGYLVYDLNYSSSLLLNGLKQCPTDQFSLSEINSKSMWLEFLDLFGGKILADGLDNFYDMMIDPITEEVLEYYKLPTNYTELLAYANYLLSDNKFFKHTDMAARRYRSNEIIAGYTYQAIADSYGEYRTNLKKNKKATMTMKQTTVLDRIMLDPTFSDFSILNPLLELEAINSVTYKGLVGMNADRAYSLDKRTFDESMLNVVGLSTGFAGNVGITRQSTIDMNIKGKRGYIKTTNDVDNMNITKTFTATEALTPFGSRRDDPFRSAMTFIQTSKHGMRVKNSIPSLITNGADQALPYLITNAFAYKASQDGKIIEKTDKYVIVEYKDGTNDFINIDNTIQKNSDGGFYVPLKLDCDLKVGNKVKKGQIIAYDKLSFSDAVGHTDDVAYNIGTLTKIGILNTDEGFEDSAIISDWLSDAMSSEVVIKREVPLPKNTNIYNMVKKGQPIKQGEPLMVFQNAFEEEDVNMLLKNLADDEEVISELGRIPIKSKVTGKVEDIKIYRTVEKEELSDSLKKKVNELEKPISDMKKIMKKYDIEYNDKFDADYALTNTGKLKKVDEGVLIEFYLKYEDKLSVGDKIIYYSALKGVIKDIFPIDKEPYTDFRPEEKVHSLLSLGSVNGRMVTSIMINGAISKVLIELDRKVKDMLDIPYKYIDEE